MAEDRAGEFLTYDGSRWTAPALAGTDPSYGVSCASATFCVARAKSSSRMLVYRGGSWTRTSIDYSGGGTATLSCVTSTFYASLGTMFSLTFNGLWTHPSPCGHRCFVMRSRARPGATAPSWGGAEGYMSVVLEPGVRHRARLVAAVVALCAALCGCSSSGGDGQSAQQPTLKVSAAVAGLSHVVSKASVPRGQRAKLKKCPLGAVAALVRTSKAHLPSAVVKKKSFQQVVKDGDGHAPANVECGAGVHPSVYYGAFRVAKRVPADITAIGSPTTYRGGDLYAKPTSGSASCYAAWISHDKALGMFYIGDWTGATQDQCSSGLEAVIPGIVKALARH